jgi:NAD-dependent oxidoreductase involved in siderophore biosynthesis
MSYEFEVFLSYRRGERLQPGGAFDLAPEGRWVHNVFLSKFRTALDNAYPGARIAIDADIPPGAPWDATLKKWVLRSKCLVAVWSSMYFRSEYCRSEFHTILDREKPRAANDEPTLRRSIVPIAWSDGIWYDDEAKASQYLRDFVEFNAFEKPLEDEDRVARLSAAMDRLCRQVANAIQSAPAWNPTWKWCDKPPLPPAGGDFPMASLQT